MEAKRFQKSSDPADCIICKHRKGLKDQEKSIKANRYGVYPVVVFIVLAGQGVVVGIGIGAVRQQQPNQIRITRPGRDGVGPDPSVRRISELDRQTESSGRP
ncbi:hypothetical protein F4782DRAFT_525193 [Xylaria castorea]|nr:hypothetical protein F4782DRAFT_525193 [Xylaria castorea]